MSLNRRKIMELLLHGSGMLTAGALVVPAVLSALSPVRMWKQTTRWKPLGPIDDFPIGEMKAAIVNPGLEGSFPKSVYVHRNADEAAIVWSRSCTDLGCPVTWDAGSQCFFCPCHGGVFSREGDRKAGPPDRPLDRYASRIVDGVLEIDLNSVPPHGVKGPDLCPESGIGRWTASR